MPVKRRIGKERSGKVPEAIWCNMLDQPLPEGCTGFTRYVILYDREYAKPNLPLRVRDYWDMHRDAVLTEWLRDNPGIRPRCWWDWDAPRELIGTRPGMWDDGTRCLSRRHIGGGLPEMRCSDNSAYMLRGVPVSWGRWWGEYLADPIGGPLPVASPPVWQPAPLYESQATYLRRLGLLLPGELRRLKTQDFEPETVTECR